MAALTDNIEVAEKDGVIQASPMAVDIIYRGALLKHNAAGYLAPCATEAGAKFAGIAEEKVDNSGGSAGDKDCKFKTKGVYLLTGTGFAQTDVGELVYASDDQTITKTQSGNLQQVGRIVKFVSSTQVWVELMAGASILGDAVELAELDSGITPSHVVKFAGEFTTVGGDTDETISVPGVVATDLVVVTMHTAGASPVTIVDASAGTDQIDVDMSADPSNDHVLTYVVFRAAS